jgi:hypothetical protein
VRLEGLGQLKKKISDLIGNRTRDLLACSIPIVGGGVQLGPLGTAATDCPIVLSSGDYDDGEFAGVKIGRRNRSTRRKPSLTPLCPPQMPLDQTRDRTRNLPDTPQQAYNDTIISLYFT